MASLYDWFALRIKNKILFSVLAVFVLVYGATLSYVYNRIKEDLMHAAEQEALSTTKILALTLYRNYEIENDIREIQTFVLRAREFKANLLEVNVLNRDLEFISSSDEDKLFESAEGQRYLDALANTNSSLIVEGPEPHIDIIYPVSAGLDKDNYVTGIVQLKAGLATQFADLYSFRNNTLVAGIVILLSISVAITLISHSIIQPIEKLFAGMNKANEGDLHVEVPVVSKDEVGYLTTTFNEMIASIRTSNEKILAMVEASRRFVPDQFLNSLGHGDLTAVQLGDATLREMTVLFMDIRGFTDMSERMSAEQTLVFLNELMEKILPAIEEHDGFIDKYIGDAVMALFPERSDDALLAAIELRKRVLAFNRERAEDGSKGIDIGVGINSGELILGTLGSAARIDTTVIGRTVNIASRLESLTKEYGVPIIMPITVFWGMGEATRRQVETKDLGDIKIRGIEDPVQLLGVVA